MFRSRFRRVWGNVAILERSLEQPHLGAEPQECLQSPTACATRAVGDSGSNFENCDLFHAQPPDTGRGVHARSWQVNRDVDVRLSLLG